MVHANIVFRFMSNNLYKDYMQNRYRYPSAMTEIAIHAQPSNSVEAEFSEVLKMEYGIMHDDILGYATRVVIHDMYTFFMGLQHAPVSDIDIADLNYTFTDMPINCLQQLLTMFNHATDNLSLDTIVKMMIACICKEYDKISTENQLSNKEYIYYHHRFPTVNWHMVAMLFGREDAPMCRADLVSDNEDRDFYISNLDRATFAFNHPCIHEGDDCDILSIKYAFNTPVIQYFIVNGEAFGAIKYTLFHFMTGEWIGYNLSHDDEIVANVYNNCSDEFIEYNYYKVEHVESIPSLIMAKKKLVFNDDSFAQGLLEAEIKSVVSHIADRVKYAFTQIVDSLTREEEFPSTQSVPTETFVDVLREVVIPSWNMNEQSLYTMIYNEIESRINDIDPMEGIIDKVSHL